MGLTLAVYRPHFRGPGAGRSGIIPALTASGGSGTIALSMPDDVEQLLSEITRRLREALAPSAIYLYGSHAYGRPARGSDLDLLVVVEDSPLTFFQRSTEAYRALRGIGVPIDVQVYTRREFDERASLPVSFERTVREKGRVLYAA
jgi:predicted nucleotidyltransferase